MASTNQFGAVKGLTLSVSEDFYQVDAEFAVFVNGVQVDGVQTATASHAAGQEQTITLDGYYDVGQSYSIDVRFLNDGWGGTASLDRNLYVRSIALGSTTQPVNAAFYGDGDQAFSVTPTAAAGTVLYGGITLAVSEDAYLGNAQFAVFVDGVQAGGVQTATASHAAGQSQTITLDGMYPLGQHSIDIRFLNDAYGGTATTDRNLYVNSITFGGTTQSVNATFLGNGDQVFSINSGSSSSVSVAPGKLEYVGVNLSGPESSSTVTPGVLGYDYVFPTTAEIDSYASAGMNIIHLPFLWERIQHVQGGPLDQSYLAQIDQVVAYANAKGLKVDLDMHNQGYGFGNLIGSSATPTSSFDSVWGLIAAHYATNPNVLFGLMSEPYVQSASDWANIAQSAIMAVRNAGATSQELLVSGTGFDSGATWDLSGNSAVLPGPIHDPDNNMAFELHQYLNDYSTGYTTQVSSPTAGVDRLTSATNWAEANGVQLFLSEFGFGSDPQSLTAGKNMLDYMAAHNDVWQGATIWGGGPWWGSGYGFSVEPSANGTISPQIALLQNYLPS